MPKLFDEGDQIEIDLEKWHVTNQTKKSAGYPVPQFPPTVMRLIEVGGMFPLLKLRLDAERTNT